MKSSKSVFTKISDLTPNMVYPLVNVVVEIDNISLRLRADGSGEVLVGDASGSIRLSFPKNFLEKLDLENSKPPAWVIKNCVCIVIGSRLVLQVSTLLTETTRVDKLPVIFFRRNRARNLSDYEYVSESI